MFLHPREEEPSTVLLVAFLDMEEDRVGCCSSIRNLWCLPNCFLGGAWLVTSQGEPYYSYSQLVHKIHSLRWLSHLRSGSLSSFQLRAVRYTGCYRSDAHFIGVQTMPGWCFSSSFLCVSQEACAICPSMHQHSWESWLSSRSLCIPEATQQTCLWECTHFTSRMLWLTFLGTKHRAESAH